MTEEIKSVLVWPRSVFLGWDYSSENKSEDTHGSTKVALAVCKMLIRDGFGRDRGIWPLEARVEVNGETIHQWTAENDWIS